MPSELRARRIADRIRMELSELLQREVVDPRLTLITVTDVKVDRELSVANVWVSALEGEQRRKEVLRALKGAAGFLRRELAQRIDLRTMPELKFRWDPTPERSDRLAQLFDELANNDVPHGDG